MLGSLKCNNKLYHYFPHAISHTYIFLFVCLSSLVDNYAFAFRFMIRFNVSFIRGDFIGLLI